MPGRAIFTLASALSGLADRRRIAILSRSPGHAESLEHARRLLAGRTSSFTPSTLRPYGAGNPDSAAYQLESFGLVIKEAAAV